ncbi:latrophilin-like protein 1 isoform X2 [Sardina pilchardus]|uniref:latrophilin-like protein 1 isoform X2 n=1 Tax=Sardina pilchardus TaxID=27697 RepID=UPI002E109E7A
MLHFCFTTTVHQVMWSLLLSVQLLASCSSIALCPGAEGTKSHMICEGSTKQLDCGADVIQIYAANYGRTNNCSCSDGVPAHLKNTDCLKSTTLDTVKQKCEGEQTCSLTASNGDFGGDPCGGTFKYLNISYCCLPPDSPLCCPTYQPVSNYTQNGLVFVPERMSWVEALHHCAERGSRLVHILDSCTQVRVEELLAMVAPCWGCVEKAWVGLERCMINPHAPWEWSGGAVVGHYQRWSPSFPHKPCCFHCGQLLQEGAAPGQEHRTYRWQDACCREKLPFICAPANGTQPCQVNSPVTSTDDTAS